MYDANSLMLKLEAPRPATPADLARLKALYSEVEFEIARWVTLPEGLTEAQAPPGTVVIRPIRREEYLAEDRNPPFVRIQLGGERKMVIHVGPGGRLEGSE